MKAEIKLPNIPNLYIDVAGTVDEVLKILEMINEGRLSVRAPSETAEPE